jgi:hypothetical protein
MTATLLSTLLAATLGVWGGAALWYQAPGARASKAAFVGLWSVLALGCIAAVWLGRPLLGIVVFAALLGGLALWWHGLAPSNDRDWAVDVAQLTRGAVEGDRLTLHKVRNFAWHSETDCLERWETRSYRLERLASLDMIMSYWRGRAIAHMLMSFGFDDGEQVAFSVEIRRERDESYSEVGGFFKEFELIVIAADERDVVRLRTNVRRERAYLYRIKMPLPEIRALLLAYVEEANKLVAAPRFYHTITINCTTLVYHMMKRILGTLPFSYRVLLSGYMPEYLYRVGRLDDRFSLDQLRALGYISERARLADQSAGFSADIRRGVPPL